MVGPTGWKNCLHYAVCRTPSTIGGSTREGDATSWRAGHLAATPCSGKPTSCLIFSTKINSSNRSGQAWEMRATLVSGVRETAVGQGQKTGLTLTEYNLLLVHIHIGKWGVLSYPSRCTRDCNDTADEGSVVEMNCSHTVGHNKVRMACSSDPRLLAHNSNRDIVAYNADCLRRDKPCGRKLLFHGSSPERPPVEP